ncbi:MAG: hypothetical protein AABZ60_19775, partial [Planctomycetota bacterium]
MLIKTILSLGFFLLLYPVFAQTPKKNLDFAGNSIEELIEKQNPLSFNPNAASSQKTVLNYEEYGFELALPKQPKTITVFVPKEEIKGISKEENKEAILYQGKLDSIDLTVQLLPSEKSLKAQMGSWLNAQQYKHKPFPIQSYRTGVIGQCYVITQYKVALAQEFQQKIVIFSLSIAKQDLATHYEKIQQILNGFNGFESSDKKEDPKNTTENKNPIPIPEKLDVKIEENWTPPSPQEIETRLKSLPEVGEEEKILYLGYACPSSIYFQIKVLENTSSGISLREEENTYIGNLNSILLLIEVCSAIAQQKLSETTKITLPEKDKLV